MGFVKTLPCCARDLGPCEGVVEADHAGGSRAKSHKAADDTCIPLCSYHHRARDWFSGPFKDWWGEQMREWLDANIANTRALYAARQGDSIIPF